MLFLVAKIYPMIIGASIKNILSRIEKKLTFFNHLKKDGLVSIYQLFIATDKNLLFSDASILQLSKHGSSRFLNVKNFEWLPAEVSDILGTVH